MKITDVLIDSYAQEYCLKFGTEKQIITSEEIADCFFREQLTEDILNYVNSRKPLDEVYLTQAMIVCADRAGLLEEWMHTFDADNKLWNTITRKLRGQIRTQKQTETE